MTPRTIIDPVYGYRRLEPIPRSEELADFYQSKYYDLLRKGGRAPELRRQMAGGETARRELDWLRATLYEDVAHELREHAPGARVLDVGCGTGELVAYLAESGFDARGIEPAAEATAEARRRGRQVEVGSLESFATPDRARSFDAATFLNVLEHVPDPVSVLSATRELLVPGGVICVRVPNDFNELQRAAQDARGVGPYWVAVPDHINYFTVDSLDRVLAQVGFDTVYVQTDFPMEFFLLMGEDYVSSPEQGAECHGKRIALERAIPGPLRRKLYTALAGVGIGRNMLVFAKARTQAPEAGDASARR